MVFSYKLTKNNVLLIEHNMHLDPYSVTFYDLAKYAFETNYAQISMDR